MPLAIFVQVCTFILPKYSKGFHKYIPDGGTALAMGHTAGNKSRDTITGELFVSIIPYS